MRYLLLAIVLVVQVFSWQSMGFADEAEDTAKGDPALEGEWLVQSMEVSGTPQPRDVAERMRFGFKGRLLFIGGNFKDSRIEECTYSVKPDTSPKELDFTPSKTKKPVLGIYELKGDELKICMRHGSSEAGRPREFVTTPGSELILLTFKRPKQ